MTLFILVQFSAAFIFMTATVKSAVSTPMCLCNKDKIKFKIREKPGIQSRVVALLDAGQCKLIIGGPVPFDRYEWYILRRPKNTFIALGPWLEWKKCQMPRSQLQGADAEREETNPHNFQPHPTKPLRRERLVFRTPGYSNSLQPRFHGAAPTNGARHSEFVRGSVPRRNLQVPQSREPQHTGIFGRLGPSLPPLSPDRIRIPAPKPGTFPLEQVRQLFQSKELLQKLHSPQPRPNPGYVFDPDTRTSHNGGPIDEKCMACMCELESNCRPLGCVMDLGSLSCGYYQIKDSYYTDCGKPGPGWKQCSNDKECSERCMYSYMKRYVTSCTDGGTREPTCEDYARIHNGGPNGCTSRRWFTDIYWNKMKRCLSR